MSLKEKAIRRTLHGIPCGVAIGYLITILMSLFGGQGYYISCVPPLAELLGSEATAVAVQAVLCGMLGGVFGGGAVIWEIEHWSIARQTGVYFLLTAAAMLPTAWLLYWMEHSVAGVLQYVGIFVGLFALIWLTQYLPTRRAVKKMNEKLR